jgi:hypothetical protein
MRLDIEFRLVITPSSIVQAHDQNVIRGQALFRSPVCIRDGEALTTLLRWLHGNPGVLLRVSMSICQKTNGEVINSTYAYLLKKYFDAFGDFDE